MTETERRELRARVEEQKKFMREHEWLYDDDGKAVVFEKTYLKQRNIMGWVYDQEEQKYIRTRRVIWSKFWLAIHNVIAHPMLFFYRPFGEWLHEYTAERMYSGPQKRKHDENIEITAIMD
jgi:hypothetical protein